MIIIRRFLKDESGATAIEYALIASLIGLGIITAATGLATGISDKFDSIVTELTAAGDDAGGDADDDAGGGAAN